MRRTALIISLCAFVAAPALADLSITTTGGSGGYGIWQTGNGGEFTFRASGWDPLPYYSDVAKNQGQQCQQEGTFQTFCLEHNEYISGSTTYDVVLNDRMVNGGVGPQGDPLSRGTAYLYHEFQNGTLAGYNYSNTGIGGRSASAQALQNAIWYLEDEEGGALSDSYEDMLIAQFGSVANAKLDNNGLFAVAVLNVYADGHAGDQDYRCQDALVCTPVPAGLLLGLLGLGAAGLKLRRFA
jgi:hypothetical protein